MYKGCLMILKVSAFMLSSEAHLTRNGSTNEITNSWNAFGIQEFQIIDLQRLNRLVNMENSGTVGSLSQQTLVALRSISVKISIYDTDFKLSMCNEKLSTCSGSKHENKRQTPIPCGTLHIIKKNRISMREEIKGFPIFSDCIFLRK